MTPTTPTAAPGVSVEVAMDRFESACKCWHQGDVDQADSEVTARREELLAAIAPPPPVGEPQGVSDERITKARAILARLCDKGLLSMSIPAREDDEDLILSAIIDSAASRPVAGVVTADLAEAASELLGILNDSEHPREDIDLFSVKKLAKFFEASTTKAGGAS